MKSLLKISGIAAAASFIAVSCNPDSLDGEEGAFSIRNTADFLEMLARPQSTTCDTTYIIAGDIDFSGVTITPDNCCNGNFYANIDGRGHKFTNYTATSDMIKILYGTVKDITIESGSFTLESDHSCGIFFEQIEKGGVAENLINKAEITGTVSTSIKAHSAEPAAAI